MDRMSRDGGGGSSVRSHGAPSLPEPSRVGVLRRDDSLLHPPASRDFSGVGSAPGIRGRSSDLRLQGLVLEMGNTASVIPEASGSVEQSATTATAPETKPKKKICCACPDTKKLRDDCIMQNGEDACGKFIEAHLQCLRAEGFNV